MEERGLVKSSGLLCLDFARRIIGCPFLKTSTIAHGLCRVSSQYLPFPSSDPFPLSSTKMEGCHSLGGSQELYVQGIDFTLSTHHLVLFRLENPVLLCFFLEGQGPSWAGWIEKWKDFKSFLTQTSVVRDLHSSTQWKSKASPSGEGWKAQAERLKNSPSQ